MAFVARTSALLAVSAHRIHAHWAMPCCVAGNAKRILSARIFSAKRHDP